MSTRERTHQKVLEDQATFLQSGRNCVDLIIDANERSMIAYMVKRTPGDAVGKSS